MAKMSLGKISNPAFTNAMQLLLAEKLPVRTAFKVKTLVNRFNDELKKFGELRKEIVERYCKKDEGGKPVLDEHENYTFDPDKMEPLTKEMSELTAIEIEVTPVKLDELGEISLSAQTLFDLGEVIDA